MTALLPGVAAEPALAATKLYLNGAGELSTCPVPGKLAAGMQAVSMHTAASSEGKLALEDEEVFVFPATLAQRRFWLLSQMIPGGNPALNMPLAIRLRGRLDVSALERAFNKIIARHEALRTVFHTEDGKLCQVISSCLTIRVPVVDPGEFPLSERAKVPDHLRREEAQTPFDLERGPLLRTRLVRLQHDEHLLLLTLNHIICDGWSVGVLIRELTTLYSAYARNEPSPLPGVPIQFADFAQWQEETLATGGLEPQLAYWRRQLAGPLPILDLPLDHPRPPGRVAATGEYRWRPLPEPLATSLKVLARRQGVTGFMLGLAAFGVLLHRYCGGQEDILVTSPSAGRGRAELEGTIGLFANPSLLRLDLSGNPTFGAFLERVRTTVLGAFANAEVPFEKLLEADLQPRRLQVNFLQQAEFAQPACSPDLDWSPVRNSASGGALTEWTAGVIEGRGADAARLFVEYNTSLYDPATIERVLAHFETILHAVTLPGGLDTPVGALPILTAEEERSLSASTVLLAARWRLSEGSVRWLEAACEATGPGQSKEVSAWKVRPGMRLAVLDGHLQPMPAGVAGEIFVAGTVANADLPALSFVADPRVPGESLFRTGDAGRWQPDGTVVLLGRADQSWQINGSRVDLAQIEAALRTHPQVHEAVVLPRGIAGARSDQAAEEQLVAYVQTDSTLAPSLVSDTCRLFLSERFTRELVPDVFVAVECFPLTPDGRLDEAALPLPDEPPAATADSRPDAPFLTIHYQLVEVWQELLGVRSIGIKDDFFALGGNSLLAMRMLNRIEQNYGKALPPAVLFKRATVEHLAEEIIRLDATANGGKPHALHALQESGSRPPIFYLHGDLTGGGYYCMKLSRRLGVDQPFYALPPVDVSTHREKMPTIEEMAAMHVQAIRAVRPRGPYIIGGFCLGGLVAYEVACQLAAAGETVERLVLIDAAIRDKRLRNLRRLAEWKGRRQDLDGGGQLYLFCRWHFLLARMERWKGLKVREQFGIAEQRLSGIWNRLGRVFRSRPVAVEAAQISGGLEGLEAAMLAAEQEEPSATSAWFDPRWDVPLVFMWAAGGYRAKPYGGPTTLLLSQDLYEGDDSKILRDWKRYVPGVKTGGLPGSHLACITEHVEALAVTIKGVLHTCEQ